ncbi:hypothetical protein CBI30_06955 [Polynucleobacter aenigmaticus]|uniref:Uncharacterized protein n=1 Tax=Polynucleobacter aenigmaticus TaxID=1743164 RepID=A0A254PY44_9BURK|nr:hypothetical protein [Polynucleobacter aenigmaticus]OWS71473.1 hypothetical protein CBI30_06955 [Polynucleobacter aenigmaticus]
MTDNKFSEFSDAATSSAYEDCLLGVYNREYSFRLTRRLSRVTKVSLADQIKTYIECAFDHTTPNGTMVKQPSLNYEELAAALLLDNKDPYRNISYIHKLP